MTPGECMPVRKNPAHRPIVECGQRTVIVYLTVCTHGRKPILARGDAHACLLSAWHQACRWVVGRYVVMPDHVHLFCAPATFPCEPLRTWVKYWKTVATKIWPRPDERPLWQADVWDTQLRRGENYTEKWQYVCENPVRAGWVSQAEDWPYQGEVNTLVWRET